MRLFGAIPYLASFRLSSGAKNRPSTICDHCDSSPQSVRLPRRMPVCIAKRLLRSSARGLDGRSTSSTVSNCSSAAFLGTAERQASTAGAPQPYRAQPPGASLRRGTAPTPIQTSHQPPRESRPRRGPHHRHAVPLSSAAPVCSASIVRVRPSGPKSRRCCAFSVR